MLLGFRYIHRLVFLKTRKGYRDNEKEYHVTPGSANKPNIDKKRTEPVLCSIWFESKYAAFGEVSRFENEKLHLHSDQPSKDTLNTMLRTKPFQSSSREESMHVSAIAPPLSISQQTAVLVVPNITWAADIENRKLETAAKRLARKRKLDAKRLCKLPEGKRADTGETDLSFDSMDGHGREDLVTLLMKFAAKKRREAHKNCCNES